MPGMGYTKLLKLMQQEQWERKAQNKNPTTKKAPAHAEVDSAIHNPCLSAFPNAAHNAIALPYPLAKYSAAGTKTSDLKGKQYDATTTKTHVRYG
jgi:hypothetical protein